MIGGRKFQSGTDARIPSVQRLHRVDEAHPCWIWSSAPQGLCYYGCVQPALQSDERGVLCGGMCVIRGNQRIAHIVRRWNYLTVHKVYRQVPAQRL